MLKHRHVKTPPLMQLLVTTDDLCVYVCTFCMCVCVCVCANVWCPPALSVNMLSLLNLGLLACCVASDEGDGLGVFLGT